MLNIIHLHLFLIVNHPVLYHRLQILTCFIHFSHTGLWKIFHSLFPLFLTLCFTQTLLASLFSLTHTVYLSLHLFAMVTFFMGGFGSLWLTPHKAPCTLTKINMAAVILSATVFGEQYSKHPTILPAFIWRIHCHTTGMSHKHRDSCETQGSPLHIYVIWPSQTRRSMARSIFFSIFISGNAF